jgi:hypothetical protein
MMEERYLLAALIAAGLAGKMTQEAGGGVVASWIATLAAFGAVCAYGVA